MKKIAIILAAMSISITAAAYPDRPIAVISTNAAGNTGDLAFRIIQPSVEKALGQRLLLVNKPGATGEIAVREVARSTADGYTLLIAPNNNFTINQFVLRSSFDPINAFVPISTISEGYSVVVVPPGLGINSLAGLQRAAQLKPGALNYGSPGIGTPPHLAAAAFTRMADISMTHVPFTGSPAVIQALLRNDVQLYFSVLSVIKPYVSAGKLKAIAVAAPRRLDMLPNVPTTAEAGFPELITGSWWAIAAPKGTPTEVLTKLENAIRSAFQDPEVTERFKQLDIMPGGISSQVLEARIKKEAEFWKKVVPTLDLRSQ